MYVYGMIINISFSYFGLLSIEETFSKYFDRKKWKFIDFIKNLIFLGMKKVFETFLLKNLLKAFRVRISNTMLLNFKGVSKSLYTYFKEEWRCFCMIACIVMLWFYFWKCVEIARYRVMVEIKNHEKFKSSSLKISLKLKNY